MGCCKLFGGDNSVDGFPYCLVTLGPPSDGCYPEVAVTSSTTSSTTILRARQRQLRPRQRQLRPHLQLHFNSHSQQISNPYLLDSLRLLPHERNSIDIRSGSQRLCQTHIQQSNHSCCSSLVEAFSFHCDRYWRHFLEETEKIGTGNEGPEEG